MSTLAQAKASTIPEDLNIGPTDDRFLKYLNSATERLLHRGHWWQTCRRFNISITSQLLTLPPMIDTPEQIAVGNQVMPIRGMWFELLPGGWSVRDETLPNGSGINECLYRGNFPTIVDIDTANTLTAKCDVATDASKEILVMGYDENGNWIRTFSGGAWSDGEIITFAQGAGTPSVNQFSIISSVQLPDDMDGQSWLYLGTVATGTLLGNYQYYETNPSYKRFLVPFVSTSVSTVVLTGKLAYRPVAKDTDELLIGNLAALKLGMMACKAESEHNWGEANLLWNGGTDKDGVQRIGALQELNFELEHHLGTGTETGMSIVGPGAGFGQNVDVLV